VKEILADETIIKIFHNATFDASWLTYHGFCVKNYTDTLILSQIINNKATSTVGANTLKNLAEKYLGIEIDKTLQSAKNWQGELTSDHYNYCLQDAKITFDLYKILIDKIDNLYLRQITDREIAVLPAVVEMIIQGIHFDYNGWEMELNNMSEEVYSLDSKIKELLNNQKLNINSTQQLKKALEVYTGLILENTTSEYLANFEGEFEVIDLILKHKKLKKLIGTYGFKLKNMIDKDGMLRGNWRLIGTDTSRMSCSAPTLQGMPSNSKKYFKAHENHVFIISDYSCIELKVLAEITQDNKLVTAFKNDEDLHRKTARIIFDKSNDSDVSDYERRTAKTINFGIIYGMTEVGLQRRINGKSEHKIIFSEAKIFINKYLQTYKSVAEYQRNIKTADLIQTIGGRYWGGLNEPLEKFSRKRLNYPVQGTAAEGFKESIALFLKRRKNSWIFRALVHDEIVIEVPNEEIEEAKTILEQSLVEGMSKLIKTVPITVETKISPVWEK
jgi:DNA polymerase I-like protein with 3'-5' exonuclease and polymerase domains